MTRIAIFEFDQNVRPMTEDLDSVAFPATPRGRLLARQPWLVFILPLAVYMLVGSLEPRPPKAAVSSADPAAAHDEAQPGHQAPQEDGSANPLGIHYKHYPILYTVKIALTIAAMIFVAPGYRQFGFRLSPLAFVVGVVGVVLWIWLCRLQLEPKLLGPLGLGSIIDMGERPAYNPLEQLAACTICAYSFLAIRFLGLALIVPVIEEFFLRGFLMRYISDDHHWPELSFGDISRGGLVVGTVVPMLMHPAELLAAAVWFSLITWLMLRTKNIWDCVAAHALTNLLLGIYVVTQHQWQLW
jgi:CAAX prenyl protease-like protein